MFSKISRSSIGLFLLLFVSPSLAAPSLDQARLLVEDIVSFSLLPGKQVRMPAPWEKIKPHHSAFDAGFFSLLEWVSTPHPDAEGREWHLEVDPLWQVQGTGVRDIKIGSAKPEGQLCLVVVDYQAPSVRASQPATKCHNVWVVGEKDGKPVLKDIRYHLKFPASVLDGSLLADMKKAQKNFKAP